MKESRQTQIRGEDGPPTACCQEGLEESGNSHYRDYADRMPVQRPNRRGEGIIRITGGEEKTWPAHLGGKNSKATYPKQHT